MLPELPPLPALTRAEGELVDGYLAALDRLGRINPARGGDTLGALQAAQALVTQAAALRDALAAMHERGERELHGRVLGRALGVLGAERRLDRLVLPQGSSTDRGLDDGP
ncbi:hypothetical protein [Streptomyces alkaliterrae]|uniref:Uncharacterized protein n=1 Tax=Streptomyces alkaliterrae TaxID=2213162 RepID=A0A5P0YLD0_9ACTN|nr:hypothetical protein [Streptomyces alkaliterrae]MBB1252969.1 hypothetical protein [Streptomyces alkaliterrae]MBB1257318.1 hypothetical protein [Streptomyces alkaliterrae]MQS01058.1 hypothetical protein [Streptomyces alkaliterrae]